MNKDLVNLNDSPDNSVYRDIERKLFNHPKLSLAIDKNNNQSVFLVMNNKKFFDNRNN